MPGTVGCVRCGTSLVLAAQAIAVHPPRASALVKRLRAWLPLLPHYYRLRDQLQSPLVRLPNWLTAGMEVVPLRFGTWLRMIIPGWAHWHAGQPQLGLCFFAAWLVMGLLCAITFGSSFSAMIAGFMLAAHAGSIVDLAWRSREYEDQRTAIAAVVIWTTLACVVVICLYLPVRQAVFSRIETAQWLDDEPPLEAGDVVLFRPVARLGRLPEAGDVVVYRRREYTIGQDYHRMVQRPSAAGLDRILAGPNSVVRWRSGQLTVNGQPSSLRPLNPDQVPGTFELQVPSGYVCIFPSTDALLTGSGSLELWIQHSIVSQDAIVGRAFLRNYPLTRWWWIE